MIIRQHLTLTLPTIFALISIFPDDLIFLSPSWITFPYPLSGNAVLNLSPNLHTPLTKQGIHLLTLRWAISLHSAKHLPAFWVHLGSFWSLINYNFLSYIDLHVWCYFLWDVYIEITILYYIQLLGTCKSTMISHSGPYSTAIKLMLLLAA